MVSKKLKVNETCKLKQKRTSKTICNNRDLVAVRLLMSVVSNVISSHLF